MAALFETLFGLGATEVEQALAVAWLLAARVAPVVVLVPAFGLRGAPAGVLVAATVAFACALLPTALAHAPVLSGDALVLTVLALRELAVGTLWALALALPFVALEWGGRIADVLRGAGFDGRGTSALGDLYLWVALAAFFAIGGHRVALAALADGLASHPLGVLASGGGLAALAVESARLCADALAAGLMVAAPIAAVLVLAEITVGAVARGAPALAGFVAFAPARSVLVLAVALLGTAALLGALPAAFGRAIDDARRLLGSLP